MSNKPLLSIIVTTYNWPEALNLVLQALNHQDANKSEVFEVVVADDGSKADTRQLVAELSQRLSYRLVHIWQEDIGFRAAMIRNKAVAVSQGDYIIFLDGDCIPQRSFVRNHLRLAEKNYFIVGNRVHLNSAFTSKVLHEKIDLSNKNFWYWWRRRLNAECRRIIPLIKFNIMSRWRKCFLYRWQSAKTCNLALWKKNFYLVNGLDESFQGWGYEDSDLVIRLIRAGVKRKSGRFSVPVIHLEHKLIDRSNENENYSRLMETLHSTHISAKLGIDRYEGMKNEISNTARNDFNLDYRTDKIIY